MRYTLGKPPKDLNSPQGRAWLENLSRLRIFHRIHTDPIENANTTTGLETLKAYSFPMSLIRNSSSEIVFEIRGRSAADAASRTLSIDISGVSTTFQTFTEAVNSSPFLIRGKILSAASSTNTVNLFFESITPEESPINVIYENGAALSLTIGDDDLATLSIQTNGSPVGEMIVSYFSVDYMLPPQT